MVQYSDATPNDPKNSGVVRLLVGVWFVMLGNGLLLVLFGVRSTNAGFGPQITSFVLAGYYVGYVAGSRFAPTLIRRLGAPSAFSLVCIGVTVVAVLPPLLEAAWFWVCLRVVQGFCFAAVYVITESWLNRVTENKNRARLLGIYVVLVMLGFAFGSLAYQFTGSKGTLPFAIAGAFAFIGAISTFRLTPVVASQNPDVHVGMKELAKLAPIGFASTFLTALANAAFLSSVAVYATLVGYSQTETAWFSFLAAAGPVLVQGPLSHWSDRHSRHIVLTIATVLAAAFAVGGALGPVGGRLPFLGAFILGGLTYTQYTLNGAEVNDHLNPEQMPSAGSHLVLTGGAGALLGALLVGPASKRFGSDGFFWVVAGAHLAVGLFIVAHYYAARAPIARTKRA
jgi:MFS family permease